MIGPFSSLLAIITHFIIFFVGFGIKSVLIPQTHCMILRLHVSFYCQEQQLCATDLGQEVGNTRLTRAIILAKLLLVICKKRKPTARLKVTKLKCGKTPPTVFASCCHTAAAFTLTATHRDVMSPGLDPKNQKWDKSKHHNSW